MSSATNPEGPLTWDEPPGLAPRGTIVVLPGRGEQPGLYERFGRRLAADAYRVRVVGDATADVDAVGVGVKALVDEADRPGPVVLVGSDTGALLALRLVALGSVTVDGLVLAGLPDPDRDTAVAAEAEPALRASCPTHQKLLRDTERGLFEAGALTGERIPEVLRERVDPAAVTVPVLGLHGANDQVSPLDEITARYAGLAAAELLGVEDGRHDVLNAGHHRSVAASVVLWLERLRLGTASGTASGTELPPVVARVVAAEAGPA
jgi:alpha-beta hydrolase superfamily lysophospholipase